MDRKIIKEATFKIEANDFLRFLTRLLRFKRSKKLHEHSSDFRYTNGVKFLAENAGAYWLIDAIALWQLDPKIQNDEQLQGIQFWQLKLNSEDRLAELICLRDKDDVVLIQKIELAYSPYFPLNSIELWLEEKTLMLSFEY